MHTFPLDAELYLVVHSIVSGPQLALAAPPAVGPHGHCQLRDVEFSDQKVSIWAVDRPSRDLMHLVFRPSCHILQRKLTFQATVNRIVSPGNQQSARTEMAAVLLFLKYLSVELA